MSTDAYKSQLIIALQNGTALGITYNELTFHDILYQCLSEQRKFSFSPSSLNAFLHCPLKFFYLFLLRLDFGKNKATEFGSAMHLALELFFKEMIQHPNQSFPNYELLHQSFESYMSQSAALFPEGEYEKKLTYGKQTLTEYASYYTPKWNKIVVIEKFINNVQVNGVKLKGKIDKLEFEGNKVTVVDYKSGNHQNIFRAIQPPNDELPNGGDYWRQAIFYKILVDNIPYKKWIVTKAEIDFLEPAETGFIKLQFLPSAADVETVKQQLQQSWKSLHAFNFFTGCEKEECPYCQLAKNDVYLIALRQNAKELLNIKG